MCLHDAKPLSFVNMTVVSLLDLGNKWLTALLITVRFIAYQTHQPFDIASITKVSFQFKRLSKQYRKKTMQK